MEDGPGIHPAANETPCALPTTARIWPVLQRLSFPTLIVWGTESDVLSEAQAQRIVKVLPHGELVAVPGVGHAPTLVEPVTIAALERFLSGQIKSG